MLDIISIVSKKNNDEVKYYKTDLEDSEPIGGTISCIAPIKYLIKKSEESKQGVTLHLLITEDAKNSGSEDEISKYILDSEEFKGYKIKVKPMYVQNDCSTAEMSKHMVSLLADLQPSEDHKVSHKVSIDISGGFRSASNFIFISMQLLNLLNIKSEECVYAKLGNDENRIVDVKDQFQMMDLLSGIQEFYISGSLKQLISFSDKAGIKELDEYLDLVNRFISYVTIGAVDMIENEIDKIIQETEKFLYKYKENQIINFVVNFIKQDIEYLNVEEKDQQIIRLIFWCLNKNLYMPAYVYYIEKMPKVFFNKGLVYCDKKILKNMCVKNPEKEFIAKRMNNFNSYAEDIYKIYKDKTIIPIKELERQIDNWYDKKYYGNFDDTYESIKKLNFIQSKLDKDIMCKIIREYMEIKEIRNDLAHTVIEKKHHSGKANKGNGTERQIENGIKKAEILKNSLNTILSYIYKKSKKVIYGYAPDGILNVDNPQE